MTSRERQVLALIRKDPMITQQAIADQLGISRSAVAGHIMNLSNKGFIKGRGYVFSDTPFVAAIGGANIDIHGAPSAGLRMHDSNPGEVHTSAGGVARNIAENLARLGADCRLISAVGNDHHGRLLLQQGRDAGIDMQNVQQIESVPTSTYLSVLDATGDMHVAVSDMSIMDKLDAGLLAKHEAMLRQASLIIGDGNLPDESLAWLADTCANQTMFFDTVSTSKATKIKPYLAAVHTLKTSQNEAEELVGSEARTQQQLRTLAKWVHAQGVTRLFVTLGKRGVFYSTPDAQGVEEAMSNTQIMQNASGAGDAFVAGLAYAWLKGWTLAKSVRFSLAAASVTLSCSATNNPGLSVAAVNRAARSHHAA